MQHDAARCWMASHNRRLPVANSNWDHNLIAADSWSLQAYTYAYGLFMHADALLCIDASSANCTLHCTAGCSALHTALCGCMHCILCRRTQIALQSCILHCINAFDCFCAATLHPVFLHCACMHHFAYCAVLRCMHHFTHCVPCMTYCVTCMTLHKALRCIRTAFSAAHWAVALSCDWPHSALCNALLAWHRTPRTATCRTTDRTVHHTLRRTPCTTPHSVPCTASALHTAPHIAHRAHRTLRQHCAPHRTAHHPAHCAAHSALRAPHRALHAPHRALRRHCADTAHHCM
jgi:hypothetical protein